MIRLVLSDEEALRLQRLLRCVDQGLFLKVAESRAWHHGGLVNEKVKAQSESLSADDVEPGSDLPGDV